MSDPIRAHPCQWPTGWAKTDPFHRKSGTFRTRGNPVTVYDGVQRVLTELARLGVDREDVVISTNVPTRLDGLPRSDRTASSPEVAVYWEKDGKRQVMAIDIYSTAADNLAAIAATLEAMRAIERHGGARVMERAFTGFTALPPPDNWRKILRDPQSLAEAKATYRHLASALHPDRGGTTEAMSQLNAAWAKAQEELA